MKKSKRLQQAQKDHERALRRLGVTGNKPGPVNSIPNYTVKRAPERPVEDQFPIGMVCAKKDLNDHRWKRDRTETPEAIQATEQKKKRIAPQYNKGGDQYITDQTALETLGRKV